MGLATGSREIHRLVCGCLGVAGSATCVLIYALGKRIWGARAGFLAGLMAGRGAIMVAESKLATTDATLTLWLVGCLFCLRELALKPSRATGGRILGLLDPGMPH